ncbi:hypothetical protein CP02DC14_1228B, partial [Chlamydia psittaci 02DC14]
FW